jgi:hypothetical protein
VQPVAVDHARRDDPNSDPLGAARDRAEEVFALRGAQLLRVVQKPQRADAVVAEALVVEENRRGHQRPREASAPRLVGAGHVADAELPVEIEELGARAAHGPENSA